MSITVIFLANYTLQSCSASTLCLKSPLQPLNNIQHALLKGQVHRMWHCASGDVLYSVAAFFLTSQAKTKSQEKSQKRKESQEVKNVKFFIC